MKEQRPRSPLASAAAVLFSVILVLGMTPLSALADQGAQNGQTSDAIELTASDDAVIADAGWYSHPEIKASMFKVAKVYLHSDGTEQYAWLVMETQSYGYAYVGSAADGNSVVASEGLSSDKLIPATQVSLDYGDGSDPETVNAFKVPIASLDQDLNISFYSNKNKKFYDRTVNIKSSKLNVCDNPGYGPVIASAGWYEHPAISSGKYFKALKTYLQSDGASQYAVIVMGSSAYTYAYVGSAADGDAEVAANGLTSDKIIPAYEVKYDYNDGTDPETVTAFKVPISSLDQDLSIAFYSKNKNTFYDRTIRLNTSGLTACEEPTAYLPAVSAPRVERLAGPTASDTAAAIAKRAYGDEKSECVVIARDDAYYDALSGAGLAGLLGAPILLTG
ncbi:MAG: cell wall-binding repeat-containing protein, partial [Coriobacteriales bacterium]|nr:cell wall-binding repeat-containing protein [Coriobacteriales bacterium]